MRESKLLKTIPAALGELHSAGLEAIYMEELGQQVTRHDTWFRARRKVIRALLSCARVKIPELPNGFTRPGHLKMYPVLKQLKERGVIEKIDEPRKDKRAAARIMYRLKNSPAEPDSEGL